MKNIVFDIGNVLLNFKPKEYLQRKIEEKDKIDLLYEQIFLSKEWIMLDQGTITEEEAINEICKRNLKCSELIRNAMHNWYEILTPIEETVYILKELKKIGLNIYFLSNFHLLAFENVNERFDFFKLFDGGVVSYKEKLIKPERYIYDKLIKVHNLNPKESIFIDDTIANIEAARELGFNAIHFVGSSELVMQLEKYDILVQL